jgi:hypothetical protein
MKYLIILPDIIINNILLEYTTIYSNKFINKSVEYKRNIKKNNSLNKINKLIYKYIIKRRYEIDYYDDSYYIPKKYWRQYYPLCERKYFLKFTIQHINLHNYEEINNIYNKYLKNPKNNLTITFNKIIDLLYDIELLNMGW